MHQACTTRAQGIVFFRGIGTAGSGGRATDSGQCRGMSQGRCGGRRPVITGQPPCQPTNASPIHGKPRRWAS